MKIKKIFALAAAFLLPTIPSRSQQTVAQDQYAPPRQKSPAAAPTSASNDRNHDQ